MRSRRKRDVIRGEIVEVESERVEGEKAGDENERERGGEVK